MAGETGYAGILGRAQELAGREWWEPVEEEYLREALEERGHADLLDRAELDRIDRWKVVDFSGEGEEPDIRWYYARGDEPRPEEFKRFDELLRANAPDGYEPWYFRVEPAGKAPATEHGSWKEETARLTVPEAVEWLKDGGNVGVAGRPDDPLVNIDIDDGEETEPRDLVETLRARSRSRGGWHGWGFNLEGDIPNLPTDDLGEIRTDWQYVVAPGSFVATAAEEVPDGADDPGYYTIEHEAPVATIDYDDLPAAFQEWEETRDEVDDDDVENIGAIDPVDDDDRDDVEYDGKSAVFDFNAESLVGAKSASDRFTSVFHGSDTSANMSAGHDVLTCWRHDVSHGGLQALAVLSEHSPSGNTACRQIGDAITYSSEHKEKLTSNAGPNAYKGDWRLVWWAWEYAKGEGLIPDDDPIPYRALLNLAVRDGVVDRDDLVERDADDGGTYLGFPDAEAYNAALELVEEEYGRDPGREPATPGRGEDREPVSALPLERLQSLSPDEAREYARGEGIEWPTTSTARERLRDAILRAMRSGQSVVLDAPTALGKSHTVATEPWLNHANHTNEQPVIHLHETREARDSVVEKSRDAVTTATLLGRTEACPVAGGLHDPEGDADVDVTIDETPASDWFAAMCEGRGIPFSVAHKYLAEHNDQGLEHLPCSPEGVDCPAVAQWDGLPRDDDGYPAFDVIHATHQFAHVPSLRMGTNLVFDERPDFSVDLGQDRVRRAVTAYLQAVDASIETFEDLVRYGKDGLQPNEHDPRSLSERYDAIRDDLDVEPDREWYLEHPDAHTLAPALARAIFAAEEQANGRYAATVPHDPPRLDAGAADDEGWNRVWVSVVFDEENTIRSIRASPDLTTARSVIGLDAHPETTLWQRNVSPDLTVEDVLEPEERQLWRYFERGLEVIQVGDATRPFSSGRYFDEGGTRAVVEHLREEYCDDFRTVITAMSVEERTADILDDAGIDDAETMHFGEEKSRNDFADEVVGLVNGCIDPGDDYVLDLLAEAQLDAEPETRVNEDGEEYRAHGRGFVGPDADAAAELLASVREQHVAQAAGRYARNAEDPDDRAVVFVRTDAMPVGFADLQVPGVEWLASDLQRDIIRELRERTRATAAEIATAVGVTKEHVRKTLDRLLDAELIRRHEGVAEHGADVYRALTRLTAAGRGVVNLGSNQTISPTMPYGEPCTWSLAVCEPGTLYPSANSADEGLETVNGGERPVGQTVLPGLGVSGGRSR